MSEPFIGEIRMAGFNFAPRGWAFCNGQLLSIAQNTALFSLLGTTFGGNGQTTFGLPNLQGRVPMHWGTGAGLTPRVIGEQAGVESVTLTTGQMPTHNHPINGTADDAASKSPSGAAPATTASPAYAATNVATPMNPQMCGLAGGNQPHENMQPYLAVTFIIALEGIFPSRS